MLAQIIVLTPVKYIWHNEQLAVAPNLKVTKGGAPVRRKAPGKFLFSRAPLLSWL